MMDLSNKVVTKRIKPDGSTYTVAAGTSAAASDIVDTAGYDGIRFIIGFGAIVSGGVQSVKIQQDDANGAGGMADLTGTSVTVADDDDNQIVIVEILKPMKRYLRAYISRATQNSTIDFALVELFNTKSLPVTQDSTVVSAELHLSPAEGTA